MEIRSRQKNPDWTWEEEILAFATYIRHKTHGNISHPAVVKLSEILRSLPIHDLSSRSPTFRNRNSVARKLSDIHTHKPGYSGRPTSGSKLDREIWQEFGNHIPNALRLADLIETEAVSIESQILDESQEELFPEGRILYSVHRRRERNASLRRRKLDEFRRRNGHLFCEACHLDLVVNAAEGNFDISECHHIKPLHEIGPTESTLDDLLVLCPTCHRIAHKIRPWPDLATLQEICRLSR
jgi:5-methylcytosine-specific restriction protein A